MQLFHGNLLFTQRSPITVRRKIFATKKFRESLPKRGGRNIHDKNIREGGSDTLRNTITWLLRLCGSSDL